MTGWNWRGDAPWFTQTTQTHDGVDALQFGGIDHNEYSELRLPIAGPAIIRFWWRVDSEGGHDQLSFLIDDVPATDVMDSPALIDDLEPWQKRAVAVPSGQHIIAWRYTKDGQNVEGEDAGWLDEVEIIDGQDPDSDGLPSIVEACLGLDWNQTSSDNLLLPTETNGQLSRQIIKGSDIEGIVPIIEISYDLEEWSSEPLETLSDTASELIVRERATSLKPRKFIRLSASVSPE